MKRSKLKKEGERWVSEEIISRDQLDQILKKYPQREMSHIVLYLAITLSALAFLTFAFSDWIQEPHIPRTLLLFILTAIPAVVGKILYRQISKKFGLGFILLGYTFFGVSLLITIQVYDVAFSYEWTYFIWSVIGLILYFLFQEKMLYVFSLLVLTIGQVVSSASDEHFSILLLLLFFIGFFSLAYNDLHRRFAYLVGISYIIQMFAWNSVLFLEIEWMLIYIILLYVATFWLSKEEFTEPLRHVSLVSAFIFGIYQTFTLQSEWFVNNWEFQLEFLILWLIMLFVSIISVWLRKRDHADAFDLLLFIPYVYLPFSYFLALSALFVYTISRMIHGYQREHQTYIAFGTIGFIVVILSTYIQFAWSVMNKALFFFIGALLLMGMSFILERRRRQIAHHHEK